MLGKVVLWLVRVVAYLQNGLHLDAQAVQMSWDYLVFRYLISLLEPGIKGEYEGARSVARYLAKHLLKRVSQVRSGNRNAFDTIRKDEVCYALRADLNLFQLCDLRIPIMECWRSLLVSVVLLEEGVHVG